MTDTVADYGPDPQLVLLGLLNAADGRVIERLSLVGPMPPCWVAEGVEFKEPWYGGTVWLE